MTQNEFIKELQTRLAEKKEWNICADNLRYYADGSTADESNVSDLEFIRDTNIHYHKIESDTLIGDYLKLTRPQNDNIEAMCRFDLKYLYESYQDGGWDSVWEIIKANIDKCDLLNTHNLMLQTNDYEMIKDHLIIRPINYTDNRFSLKNCVYRLTGDIALVLYMIICDDEENGLNTAKLPRASFEEWEMDENEVWESALMNTYALAPPRLYTNPLDTYKPPYEKGAFMSLGYKVQKFRPMQFPVVTTVKQTNGAIALFYPGVKERLSEMAGGSFYVAFTSIHEANIHRKGSIPPIQILRTLKEMNQKFDPKEILTRKVFYYDAQKGAFDALNL